MYAGGEVYRERRIGVPVRGHNGMCKHIRRVTRQGVAADIQQHRLSRETLLYEVLPFLEEMGTSSGEILWCSYPDDVEG